MQQFCYQWTLNTKSQIRIWQVLEKALNAQLSYDGSIRYGPWCLRIFPKFLKGESWTTSKNSKKEISKIYICLKDSFQKKNRYHARILGHLAISFLKDFLNYGKIWQIMACKLMKLDYNNLDENKVLWWHCSFYSVFTVKLQRLLNVMWTLLTTEKCILSFQAIS